MDDFCDNRSQFTLFGAVNQVRKVLTTPKNRFVMRVILLAVILQGVILPVAGLHHGQRAVLLGGHVFQVHGNGQHFQLIDLRKFLGFGQGGSGHAGQFFVHAEVVLNGDGGVGHIFRFNLDAFFRLHSLVQPFRPAPAGHKPAGEFVHDDDLTALDDIILVASEQVLGTQRLLQVTQQPRLFRADIFRSVRVAQWLVEYLFHVGVANFSQRNLVVFLVNLDIFGIEGAHHLRHTHIVFRFI